MANVFANLPMPALNGAGASVNVSSMGAPKTIVCEGTFPGALVTVEASVDGGVTFAPVVSFQGSMTAEINVAAEFMRVNVAGRKASVPFAANVDVSANDAGALFLAITMPAGNGAGAAVNAAALGSLNTFIAGGTFNGARILVEVSEDNVGWAPLVQFSGQGGLVTKVATAQFYRANVSGRRAGVPFTGTVAVGAVNDPSSGSTTGAGSSTCLIYQPGGPSTGPGTFNDWTDLMTALATYRANASGSGCYTIMFDDSFASPAVIPAGGPYDMTNVVWEGGNANFGVLVEIADGATFTGLRRFTNNVQVLNSNTATSPIADLVDGDIIELRGADLSTALAGVAFIDGAALGGGDTVIIRLLEGATFGFQALGPVTDWSVAASVLFLDTEGVSSVFPVTVVGAVGAVLLYAASSMQQVPTNFSNWAGTINTPRLDIPMSLLPNPYRAAPSAAALAPATFDWARYDTSGGDIAETLPSISGDFEDPGGFLLVTNYAATGVLTLAPAVGNTIDGGAGAITVPPGGSILLICDGVSDWRTVVVQGAHRFSPPEKWAQTNVVDSQTDVPLGCLVSMSFDTIKMIRAGSIVGLGTRFSETVTAGQADVTVTINGVAGTLTLAHTSISNQDGGQATQARLIDVFAAGDEIGIQITTNGTFAPATTDLEAWLEIEEGA